MPTARLEEPRRGPKGQPDRDSQKTTSVTRRMPLETRARNAGEPFKERSATLRA